MSVLNKRHIFLTFVSIHKSLWKNGKYDNSHMKLFVLIYQLKIIDISKEYMIISSDNTNFAKKDKLPWINNEK